MKYLQAQDNATRRINNEDIKSYHDVCEKEYSLVRFTGISGAESKKTQNIEEFYVENTFSCYHKDIDGQYRYGSDVLESIQLREFFNYATKIVLIGGAGLGKSTTLNYLFCKYEQMYNLYALKIKLDLKDYAKAINEDKKDILWCITAEFYKRIKRARLSFNDAENLLGEYLEKGNCLIIFDALDEIPTQAIRNKVRDEIGNFCDIYYLNRFIISTREAGYLRNRFDDTFLHIKINEFNDEQIKTYSQNWFSSYYMQNEFDSFEDFWEKFEYEVDRARCQKLIRNPIVLILALVIFDIQKNLPNRRVEFYKKCIETFLTVREDRKAVFELSEKAKNILGIDLVVPKIASYKFFNTEKNMAYKFSYEELRKSVFKAIEVEDEINWSDAIKQYTQYLVERTELIKEIDEDILDFAHKTFYEYFLAVFFAKEYENAQLSELLEDWIGDANYDELSRLITEVIIQIDDPKQHQYIINFLFMKIDKTIEGEESNTLDIFSILADLYGHNMLQPKFHTMYHNCVLHHSYFIERARIFDKTNEAVRYDGKILAKMFSDALNDDEAVLGEIIDSIYYLNNDFKQNLVEMVSEEYMPHITRLFSMAYSITRSHSEKYRNKADAEISYFVNGNGVNYTRNYPQVFISVVDLVVVSGKWDICDKLLEFDYPENSNFFKYTSPHILFALAKEATNSAEVLLLTMILIIHCAKGQTNRVFEYLFMRDSEKDVDLTERIQWLWGSLCESESFNDFKIAISMRGLYNEQYDDLYQRLFNDYLYREKSIKSHVEEILLKRKRNYAISK